MEIEITFSEETFKGRLTNLSDISMDNYKHICISDLFERTLVENLFVHKSAISEIIQLIETYENKKYEEDGGFLLGKYYPLSDGKFNVYIDKFLMPSSFELKTSNLIKFGTTALIELDSALCSSENILVGWFHTHPFKDSDMIFLSNLDKNIQYGSFYHPWQLAIISNPFTPKFQTGIFSWKNKHIINNRDDMISPLLKLKDFQ